MGTQATSVARHWIDGEWADSDEHADSVNPATGEVIGSYAMAGPKEAQAAIEAAKRAFAEAIAMANDSHYGLSASVFSRDVDVSVRVALALESGSVWVNDWAKLHDQFEEGGFKGSGLGSMRGFAVIDDFIEFKHIRLQPGSTPAT